MIKFVITLRHFLEIELTWKIMKFSTVIVLLFCLLYVSASSEEFFDEVQDTSFFKLRYGGFFSYGLNLHNGNFNQLPGVPNCCNNFNSGTGLGLTLGALVEYPFTYDIFAQGRLGFNTLSGVFREKEATNIIVDGVSVPGIFEHELESSISNIEIQILATYRAVSELYFNGGLKVGYILAKSFNQSEILIEPKDRGTFLDGTRIRNQYSGDIPEANNTFLGLTLGAHYSLPLNKRKSYYLQPEIYYSYYPTKVVKDLSWNIQTLRAGISVKYQEPPPPPPPPPMPAYPPDPDFPDFPKPPVISANIALIQLDSNGREMEEFDLKIEDFISLNLRPLLNYVFFDENKSEIPNRYFRLTQAQSKEFSNKSLENLDVLETYYHVLNIIGRRLYDFPNAKITLVGTNSNLDSEKDNKELSLARANAVKDYLTSVWSIADNRISLVARNLPKDASDNKTPEGQTENRRVEIITDVSQILEPVITTDTLRQFNEYYLRFFPSIVSDAGLKNWNLKISQSNRELVSFGGSVNVPDSLDWVINPNDTSAPKRGGQIFYQLKAVDSINQVAASPLNWIPIDQISIEKKRMSGLADKEFEYYSLILFDFGKSKLDIEHKSVLDFVRSRIKPKSLITITGHTDRIGDDKVNLRLSQKRADEAAKHLKIKNAEIKGLGKSILLYDNILPEGRFYCRTVRIMIENPVESSK